MGHGRTQAYNGGMRYGIVADDLTGSCDVAARLIGLGYRPVVAVGPGKPERSPGPFSVPVKESAVVILNTRSRDCSVQEAAARARAAAEVLERNHVPLFYQKIDSTLRGPWAEALNALAKITAPDRVLVCPAFPARGRFVRQGQLCLKRNVMLNFPHAAEIKKGTRLRTILLERCHWQAKEIELEVVRLGTRSIQRALWTGKPARCVVCDAQRERDLQTFGRAFRNSTRRLLWVGSAGLVRHVTPLLSPPESSRTPTRNYPWLLIQGSHQPMSQVQFRKLQKRQEVYVVNFLPGRGPKALRFWSQGAIRGLAEGKNVAVVAPEQFDARVPVEFPRMVHAVLQALGRKPILAGIFVTGGNTADALCDSLRLRTLRVVEEIRPGIALSLAMDGRWPGLQLITKAGSFGGPEEVWKIFAGCCRAR